MKSILKYSCYAMVILSLLLIVNCDKNPAKPDFQQEVNIYGFLWANEYLDLDHALMINYTLPIEAYYEIDNATISNVKVTLTDLSTNKIFQLQESADKPGFYFNDSVLIKPKTSYFLKVETADKIVTATTTVPPVLNLETELSADSVNYVYRNNLGYSKPIKLECENEEQIIYVDMFCNESWENAEYIYPFSPDSRFPQKREEYDGGVNGEPRHIQAFMKLRDLVTEDYPNQYVIYWYASMIVFYGSNTMQVLAIDDNYHRYLYQEHPVLSGGIEGGIGVFGSVSGEKYDLFVMKADEN